MVMFAQIVFGLTIFGIIGALILAAVTLAYHRIREGSFLDALGCLWVAMFFISGMIIVAKG